MSNILVAGIYLANKPNTAGHITFALADSPIHTVTQRWAAIAPDGFGTFDLAGTVAIYSQRFPKFALINTLTPDALDFDWCIITDDDIELPPGFLERFLDLAEKYDFALCQPARTEDSYIDHGIVMRAPGCSARLTRFVEIGPMVALRRDAVKLLLPFHANTGMGWGLDFIWPVHIERAGLRMGIVDATPVAHRMRKPVSGYHHSEAARAMGLRIAESPHLTQEQAFRVLEAYV
jgi:glycosyltransferase involved in cell wall biosynthesis